ncbi:MAG: hypothetical protein WBG69_04465 [Arcobacteraceae bacterium]
MKILVSFLFLVQSYIYGCTLCATDIPRVLVDATISYEKKQTSFDVKWHFHEEFVKSLTQYDLNENQTFEPNEQDLIKESLVTYLENLHYLTDIEYKHINKLTEPNFIEDIKPTFSKLEFANNTMTYHYKFSLPFALENKHTLYLGFSDDGDNFSFTIRNLLLHNYKYAYSLENKLIYTKIKLDDPSIIEVKKIAPIQKDDNLTSEKITPQKVEQQSQTYMGFLSQKLNTLKEKLKITLKEIKQNNSISSYIWLLVFSFLYGILHAIGPGHGKSLVSSYFINQEKSYIKAFSISSLIGVVHTFSAFILTLVVYYSLGFIFNSAIVNIEQIATKISAIIIILIALYLIYKKTKKQKSSFKFTTVKTTSQNISLKVTHTENLSCGCSACKTTSTDLGVILAAGIIPCPGTVTIFLFTMSLGIYFVGFLSALFMSAGMSLIIFITAVLSVKIRKSTARNTALVKFFEYGSLLFILGLGVFLFIVS